MCVSFVKLGVTVVKYTPQLWLNYVRKSTEGWAIANVWLDLTGGVLSMMQLVVDAVHEGDVGLVTDNPVKLGLSFLSIFYDVLFLLQHYVWFVGGAGVATPTSASASLAEFSPLPARADEADSDAEVAASTNASSVVDPVVPISGRAPLESQPLISSSAATPGDSVVTRRSS